MSGHFVSSCILLLLCFHVLLLSFSSILMMSSAPAVIPLALLVLTCFFSYCSYMTVPVKPVLSLVLDPFLQFSLSPPLFFSCELFALSGCCLSCQIASVILFLDVFFMKRVVHVCVPCLRLVVRAIRPVEAHWHGTLRVPTFWGLVGRVDSSCSQGRAVHFAHRPGDGGPL